MYLEHRYRRFSNYIFIFYLTSDVNGLDKGNCKKRRDSFKFWDLVRLISEVLRLFFQPQITWTKIDSTLKSYDIHRCVISQQTSRKSIAEM